MCVFFSHPLQFHESPKFPVLLIKNSTHPLSVINSHLTSVRCMLRFAHIQLKITKTITVFLYAAIYRPNQWRTYGWGEPRQG